MTDGERPGALASAGHIPYSGVTPPSGLVEPLVYLAPGSEADAGLAGKLMLVEMPRVACTGKVFHQSSVHVHDPGNAMRPETLYARPFQMLGPFMALLDSQHNYGTDALTRVPYADLRKETAP